MAGEQTRAAIAAQPEWLAHVPTDRRFPDARLLFTGCGTSFHAAQTGGEAVQALELVLRPQRDAEVLVVVSHEGDTAMSLEAARAWDGPRWLITEPGMGYRYQPSPEESGSPAPTPAPQEEAHQG